MIDPGNTGGIREPVISINILLVGHFPIQRIKMTTEYPRCRFHLEAVFSTNINYNPQEVLNYCKH